jgi:hypothetical protein
MEDVGILYGNLVYFTAIWYIFWSSGICLVIFFTFWYVAPRKIWQPCTEDHFDLIKYFNGRGKIIFVAPSAGQSEANKRILFRE